MSYDGPPLQEIADDFYESFKDYPDEKLTGPFFRFLLMGLVPAGLDVNEPRVAAIIKRAREYQARQQD